MGGNNGAGIRAKIRIQQGKGLIKVNGQPISLVQPEILRFKVRRFSESHSESWEVESGRYPDR